MITFMVLYWIIGFFQKMFDVIFHPIQTFKGSLTFKIILFFFALSIGLMIFMIVVTVYLAGAIFLLIFDLIKYLINSSQKKTK